MARGEGPTRVRAQFQGYTKRSDPARNYFQISLKGPDGEEVLVEAKPGSDEGEHFCEATLPALANDAGATKCPANYASSQQLRQHEQVFHLHELLRCHCDRLFVDISNLRKHQRGACQKKIEPQRALPACSGKEHYGCRYTSANRSNVTRHELRCARAAAARADANAARAAAEAAAAALVAGPVAGPVAAAVPGLDPFDAFAQGFMEQMPMLWPENPAEDEDSFAGLLGPLPSDDELVGLFDQQQQQQQPQQSPPVPQETMPPAPQHIEDEAPLFPDFTMGAGFDLYEDPAPWPALPEVGSTDIPYFIAMDEDWDLPLPDLQLWS